MNSTRTKLAAGTCDVKWTRIARESTTNWMTLSTVHAWITSAVVIICIIAHTIREHRHLYYYGVRMRDIKYRYMFSVKNHFS